MIPVEKGRIYNCRKIGNRDEPESHNQERMYNATGLIPSEEIRCGVPLLLYPADIQFFHTSRIRSIYEHETNDGYDKLVLPANFPSAADLKIPELKKGDVLLGTMNSVYLLTKTDRVLNLESEGE